MKQKLAIILFISMVSWIFYVIVANAIPPSPPSSGSDVAITGGNVTGITNFSATTGNVTTLKWGQKVSTFTTEGNANVTDQNGGLIDIYGAANTTVTLTTVVSGMHFDVLCSNTDCCIDTTDTWN